ncbi:hypothetical protein EDB85DRAFT_325698 [Lactarius pseudohatsudake]|nr:hypothetical protein EDB85DRAFT_325698 [Lactarius pseudohatsudake]
MTEDAMRALHKMLWTAYLMILENDGVNERQLREYALVDGWLRAFWFDEDRCVVRTSRSSRRRVAAELRLPCSHHVGSSGSSCGRPPNSTPQLFPSTQNSSTSVCPLPVSVRRAHYTRVLGFLMRVVMCVLMCIHPCMARAGALKVANKQMLPSSTHIPLTAFPLSSFAISSYLAPPFSLDQLIFHPSTPPSRLPFSALARRAPGGFFAYEPSTLLLLPAGEGPD